MTTIAFDNELSSAPTGLRVRTCASIAGPMLLTPKRHGDARGFFCESFKTSWFEALGISATFLQDNQSLSRSPGVVRGLHFQAAPHAQGKLLRVLRGSVFDVIVDIRRGSPSYGQSLGVRLDAETGDQLWVPVGFAHGFATLEPDTEVLYKVTAPYAPDCEGGLLWNDPALGVDWPVAAEAAVLSDRDRTWPTLSALQSPFTFETGGAP